MTVALMAMTVIATFVIMPMPMSMPVPAFMAVAMTMTMASERPHWRKRQSARHSD